MTVQVGYNFSSSFERDYQFDPDSDLGITTYGEDSPYGAGTPYGGINIAYRYRAHLERQKCTSIRFKIKEQTVASTDGTQEGFTVTSLGLEAGIKKGIDRLRSSQSKG